MQVFLLLLALSIDVFAASFSCGMGGIRIRLLPAVCISMVCSAVLAFSLSIGTLIDRVITDKYTTIICFLGLFLVGMVKIVEYLIKVYIKKNKQVRKQIRFKFKQLNIVLQIYNNPQLADMDESDEMSIKESIFFALAMSMDGLFGGIGAAFLKINITATVLINFVISFILILAGYYVGEKTSAKIEKDVGWISGALFLLLAFRKLLFSRP